MCRLPHTDDITPGCLASTYCSRTAPNRRETKDELHFAGRLSHTNKATLGCSVNTATNCGQAEPHRRDIPLFAGRLILITPHRVSWPVEPHTVTAPIRTTGLPKTSRILHAGRPTPTTAFWVALSTRPYIVAQRIHIAEIPEATHTMQTGRLIRATPHCVACPA